MTSMTVFTARRIITMNHSNPEGTAIGVRDGRVVGVGTLDEVSRWGDVTVDDRFAGKVLVPGFVEAHSHVAEGGLQQLIYVGYFDRRVADGSVTPGCRTVQDVIDRLQAAHRALGDDPSPLVAHGLDPIYYPGERITAEHLDRATDTRPIVVMHASGHLATANTPMLRASGITAGTLTHGVVKGPDGEPNGELQEPPAMSLVPEFRQLGAIMSDRDAIVGFGQMARIGGVTTLTDLMTQGLANPDTVAMWHELVDDDSYPARTVPFLALGRGNPQGLEESVALGLALQQQRTDKVLWGGVKLMLDGSIQGWTAQVSFPGYITRTHMGYWGMAPEAVSAAVLAYHRAGLQLHAHCNGDLTSGLFIDAVDDALVQAPRWDHRHTVTHCQLTTPAQYRRMKALGMCANIFSNHIRYWGDQHRDLTVGPDRAKGMNAAATAKRLGVPFTLHSDAPVTPLGGLHLMWCAVNRLTASGQVLGEHERISAYDALEAVTLGGAYVLKLDHLVGSLEPGKYADMAVLDDDPLQVPPGDIKDIPVWGTVVGGHVHPNG